MKKIDIPLEKLEPLFEKLGQMTRVQRILICAGVLALLIGVFVYLFYLPKFKSIDRLNGEYQKLSQELSTAKKNARQLKKYQQEMKEAQGDFQIALKALPEKKELPTLLANVSQSGQESGLDFLLFKPKPDNVIDFYAELPVSIEINGSYHNVALFFDRVSRLSRLVNIKDIEMVAGEEPGSLKTKCTAVTYRFTETAVPEKVSKPKKRGKK